MCLINKIHSRNGAFLAVSPSSIAMHSKNDVKTRQGKIACATTELNLGNTLHGGQSFRWSTKGSGYRGVFNSCVWTLEQNETHLTYTVHNPSEVEKNYDQILSDYLRLDVLIEEQCKIWTKTDIHFEKSSKQISGVRILNQDVVENLFSFICSSNNNIQRISTMVEKLCTLFGHKLCSVEGEDFYDFPFIESLAQENVESVLRKEKFGYRAGYIVNTAKRVLENGGLKWLQDLHKKNNVPYPVAREELISLPGVGSKVADCICLMSLGHLEAIPVDTHIFQIACANYLSHLGKRRTVTPKIQEEIGNYLRELWGPLAGWAQAIVFSAKINTNSVSSQKRKSNNSKKLRTTKTHKKE